MLESYPASARGARTKGIPAIGAGVIYPVPEASYVVEPFVIPKHFHRVYALDVGWNRTAALWCAIDRDSETGYLYSEHYRSHAEPAIHAEAIKARGDWIPGAIDPAADGSGLADGSKLLETYEGLGLHLIKANNAVEAGLLHTFQLLSQGSIKVFSTLSNFLTEIRLYRRDEKGRVVKERDHLMDCLRYITMTGWGIARTKPTTEEWGMSGSKNWMSA